MKKSKRFCKLVTWLLVFVMLGTGINLPTNAAAKKKPSLNRSRATIRVGKKVKLKVKNYKKKVKWSSSKKKVATVTAKGLVRGRKPGKAVIKARAGKRVLKCRVTVKKKNQSSDSEEDSDPEESEEAASASTPGRVTPTSTPNQTAGTQSSIAPSAGQQPIASNSTGSTENPVMPTAPVQTSSPPLVLPSEEPDPSPIIEETETPPPAVFDVTVYTYKDGELWEDSGNLYYLKRQGADLFEEGLTVENGTYDVYVSEEGKSIQDTGEDITVQDRNRKVHIYYFTIRYFAPDKDNIERQLDNIEPTLVRKGQKVGEPTVIPGKENFKFKGWYWYGEDLAFDEPVAYNFEQPVMSAVWLYAEFTYSPGSTVYTAEYYYEKLDGGYPETADKTVSDIGNVVAGERVEAPDDQNGFEPDNGQENSYIVNAGGTTVAKFYYKRNCYTVTWKLNGGVLNGAEQDVAEQIKYEAEVTPPSGVEKRGYTCAGWADEQSVPLTANQHMSASDTAYTAVWTPEKYAVSYDLGGGSWVQDGQTRTDSYTIEDQTITLSKQPWRKGYDFAGWTGSNGEEIQKIVTIPTGSTGDRNYIAHWTPTQYTITYQLGEGQWQNGNAGPASYTIEDNDITLPTPIRSGYTFAGWDGGSQSDKYETPEKTVVIKKGSTDTRLYRANWIMNVVITPTPKVTPTPTSKVTPTPTPKVTPTPTAKVTPTPTPAKYTITYNLDGGSWSSGSPQATYTAQDNTFTLPTPVRSGYTFTGWTGTGITTAQKTVTVAKGSTGNRSYTANWSVVNYTITYELNGGSWSSGSPQSTYTIQDNDITLPTPVRNGYTFAGWTGSNGGTAQKTVTIAKGSTGSKSYTANWTPVNYTITYNLNGGSWSSGSPQTSYTADNAVTLLTPVKSGYTFAGWTGTGITTAQKTVTIAKGSTGNRSYTANWTQIQPSAAPSAQPGGPTGVTFEIATKSSSLGQETVNSWVFHLGDSVSQIQKQFANLEPEDGELNEYCIRQDKTPQGYTAYVCRPYGYPGLYFQIYVDNGKVVGMAAVSKCFRLTDADGNEIVSSYGVTSASKNSSSALKADGFATNYKYKNALFKSTADYHAAAFVDPYGGHLVGKDKVYGVQIFAATNGSGGSVSAKDVFETATISKKGGYTTAVNEAQGKELTEWATAFRQIELESALAGDPMVADNKSAFLPVAQIHSELMASSNNLTSSTLSGEKDKIVSQSKLSGFSDYIKDNNLSKLTDRLLYATFFQVKTDDSNFNKNFFTAEATGSGSPDALGYLTWQLEDSGQTGTYADLLKEDFSMNYPFNEFYVIGGFASASSGNNFTFATLDMIGSVDPKLP